MEGRVVAAAAVGTLLSLVVFTAPLATLDTIAVELGSTPSGQSWILSSMSVGLTVSLLSAGTLADRFGTRRVFCLGALLLASASLLAAGAPDTVVFVAARVAQGAGAAAVVACSLALIARTLPPGPMRTRASGVWGAALATGIAVGPLLASLNPWRQFSAAIALSALVLAGTARACLGEDRAGERPRKLDVRGLLLLAVGLTVTLVGLTESRRPSAGIAPWTVVVCGLVVIAFFVRSQFTAANPMVDLALLRRPGLVAATLGSLASGLGIIAVTSFLPTVLQRGLRLTPLQVSWELLAWSCTSLVAALLTRRISEHLVGPVRLVAGLLIVALGLTPIGLLQTGSGRGLLVFGLVVAGVGTGIVNATLGREAVANVPAHQVGMGSGINNTARYLGAAVGVTVVSMLTVPKGPQTVEQLLDGWYRAVWVCTGVTIFFAATIGVVFTRCRDRERVES